MITVPDDHLINELRGLLPLVTGHGMHISVRGDQLRAALGRIDSLQHAPLEPVTVVAPSPPVWQEALPSVLRILAEVIEDHAYTDLCGTNLVDAIQAWAARNHTTLTVEQLTAVDRALSGE
jgi:hypothetical protein